MFVLTSVSDVRQVVTRAQTDGVQSLNADWLPAPIGTLFIMTNNDLESTYPVYEEAFSEIPGFDGAVKSTPLATVLAASKPYIKSANVEYNTLAKSVKLVTGDTESGALIFEIAFDGAPLRVRDMRAGRWCTAYPNGSLPEIIMAKHGDPLTSTTETLQADARQWVADRRSLLRRLRAELAQAAPHNKPLAVSSLSSYRCKGNAGSWIMIGANSTEEALSEAARSGKTIPDTLEVWDGERYMRVH